MKCSDSLRLPGGCFQPFHKARLLRLLLLRRSDWWEAEEEEEEEEEEISDVIDSSFIGGQWDEAEEVIEWIHQIRPAEEAEEAAEAADEVKATRDAIIFRTAASALIPSYSQLEPLSIQFNQS